MPGTLYLQDWASTGRHTEFSGVVAANSKYAHLHPHLHRAQHFVQCLDHHFQRVDVAKL
jgi:hypothetical protein